MVYLLAAVLFMTLSCVSWIALDLVKSRALKILCIGTYVLELYATLLAGLLFIFRHHELLVIGIIPGWCATLIFMGCAFSTAAIQYKILERLESSRTGRPELHKPLWMTATIFNEDGSVRAKEHGEILKKHVS